MKSSADSARRKFSGAFAGALLGGLATAVVAAPSASAAPQQCSADGLANTVRTVTGDTQQYLATHPGAGQVLTAAANQPYAEAQANVRGYFTANPGEYYELRGILAPLGDTERQCNVSLLPPQLAIAYNEFMAG